MYQSQILLLIESTICPTFSRKRMKVLILQYNLTAKNSLLKPEKAKTSPRPPLDPM